MTTEEGQSRRLSLRVLLLLIFAAALSPVLVIGGLRWSGDVEREAQYRRETMTLVAEVAAGRAQAALASAPQVLNLISSAIASDPCNAPIGRIVEALPDFGALGVVDADGAVACSTQDDAAGTSVAERPWFRELQTSGARYVQSTAFIGLISREWIVATAARRETPDGKFSGAIVLGLPVNRLIEHLDQRDLPETYDVALLDRSGQVFASSQWEAIDPQKLERIGADGPGFLTLESKAGESREAAVVPLANSEFFAMVSAPTPTPITLANVSAFSNFALPLLAWLLALVTAWLAMDRLVLRWLDYLRRIATLYASGKLTVQPLRAKRQAPGEITSLADTLEEMAIRIRDRTSRMENALEARDAAMKEIHHRVKNNLQIINSLLSLQSRKLRDKAAIAVLDDARARINALSLIHRSLYEHTNISSVETRSFLAELASHLDQALGAEDRGIRIESAIAEDSIDADVAVPLALFTAEAVTNSMKHAFPMGGGSGKGWRVLVSYTVSETEAVLSVEDNGVGYDPIAAEGPTGIGGTLMAAFAKQVRGTLEDTKSDLGGRAIRVRMPRVKGVTAGFATAPPAVDQRQKQTT